LVLKKRASGFQLIVVVSPLVNFPILDLRDGYASHANGINSKCQNRKDSVFVANKRPVTGDAVSTAEDGIGLSLGIPEEFTCVALLSAPIAAEGRIDL
jgi:hypothetical protein